MGGWFETAGVILVAAFGAAVGRAFSRLKGPHWVWGYFLPLVLVTMLLISTYAMTVLPILFWFSYGRIRFVILGLAVTMGSMTLLGRLNKPLEKLVVFALMLAVVIWSSILPFLVPNLIKADLTAIDTQLDSNNICYQTTDYTCGPAAAVTALNRLGLSANEGEIAVLSHTSPTVGTMPWSLYKAIQHRYETQGLECQFRNFDSVIQLREADVTLAVVRDAFLLDHCVAILEVGDHTVTIADPVLGRILMSHKEFEHIWRFFGITLNHPAS